MSLRLYFEEKAFGPGMVMLLREVERTGSLQKAAKNMNMAYSKAWKKMCIRDRLTDSHLSPLNLLLPDSMIQWQLCLSVKNPHKYGYPGFPLPVHKKASSACVLGFL